MQNFVTGVLPFFFIFSAIVLLLRIGSSVFNLRLVFKETHPFLILRDRLFSKSNKIIQFLQSKKIFSPSEMAITFVKVFFIVVISRFLIMLAASYLTGSTFFSPDIWMKWDARHYLKLAELGYFKYTDFSEAFGEHVTLFLVFFPFYPWMVRLVSLVTYNNYYMASLIVSNTAFLFAAWYLHRLVTYLKNSTIAFWAVIMLCFSPATVFFGMPYTESLFLLTSTASLYYASQKKWLKMGVWGFFSALTRVTGILVIVPAFFIWLTEEKPIQALQEKRFSDFWHIVRKAIPWIAFTTIGTGIYLLLNYVVSGNPFQFLVYQEKHWWNTSISFWDTLSRQWNEFFPRLTTFKVNFSTDETSNLLRAFGIHGSNIFSFIFATIALIPCLFPKNGKLTPYLLYIAVYMVISFSASWLLSGARYVFACSAVYLSFATMLEKKYLAVFLVPLYVVFSFILFLLFLLGTVL